MLRYQRLIMGLPAEDCDSRASSNDSMPSLGPPTSSSDVSQMPSLNSTDESMPDLMFPVMEIEHGRFFV